MLYMSLCTCVCVCLSVSVCVAHTHNTCQNTTAKHSSSNPYSTIHTRSRAEEPKRSRAFLRVSRRGRGERASAAKWTEMKLQASASGQGREDGRGGGREGREDGQGGGREGAEFDLEIVVFFPSAPVCVCLFSVGP